MLQRVSYFRSTWCHFPLVLFVIGQCPLRQTDHIVPFFNRHHNPRTSETNQPPTMAIPIWILSPAVYHPRWAFRCCNFICIHPRCNFLPSVHCRWGQYRHIHVIIVSPNFHVHRPHPSLFGISSLLSSSLHFIPSHSPCLHYCKSLHTSLHTPHDIAPPHPSKTAPHTVQLNGLSTQFIRCFPNNIPAYIIRCNYLSAHRLSYGEVLRKFRRPMYSDLETAHHTVQVTG